MTNLRLEELLRILEDETGVNRIMLCSERRLGEAVQARYIFYHLASAYLMWEDRQILAFLNRNRTMSYHFRTTHNRFMNVDRGYNMLFNRIKGSLDCESYTEYVHVSLSPEQKRRAAVFNKNMLIGVEA